MKGRMIALLMGVVVSAASLAGAADMKPIHTQKTKDVVVILMSDSGQWKEGKNDFVLELTSAKDKQPVDAGKVTLSTSMTTSGMPPMIGGASLPPDRTPRRHLGT